MSPSSSTFVRERIWSIESLGCASRTPNETSNRRPAARAKPRMRGVRVEQRVRRPTATMRVDLTPTVPGNRRALAGVA